MVHEYLRLLPRDFELFLLEVVTGKCKTHY